MIATTTCQPEVPFRVGPMLDGVKPVPASEVDFPFRGITPIDQCQAYSLAVEVARSQIHATGQVDAHLLRLLDLLAPIGGAMVFDLL